MYAATPLPLFPTPYPGESLYSVFCRYHIRSGNCSDQDTIRQLFGRYLALNSTLLTPYRLNYAERWYAPSTGITRWKLMTGNSAYPYYSLFNWTWRKKSFTEISSGCSTSPRTTALLSRNVSSKTFLCYCPECAREDRLLYGETYWHILPQINGVEYCPRHKCPIVESSVEVSKIKYHLIPANQAIKHRSRFRSAHHDSQSVKNFLDLAEDSEWMLLNGLELDYRKVTAQMAHDVCRQPSYCGRNWKETIYNDSVLKYMYKELESSVSESFLKYLLSLYQIESVYSDFWKFMMNCYVVRLVQIRCLYGGVEKLYHKLQRRE